MTSETSAQLESTISEQLAEHVVGTRFADLPVSVVEKAKLCILDTLGVAVAGSRERVARIVADYAISNGPSGACVVIGRRDTVDPAYAALANGTAAHVLDWDDGHRPSGDHLGGPVVPGALAVAEHTEATGEDLIVAVVVGYDAMGRVGESVCLPRGPGRFFHGNGVNGTFGVAAAAGKLLDLTAHQMTNAFGLAGDGASGLRQFSPTGSDTKSLHVGRAGHAGITAAGLALGGLEGALNIFEGPVGYCRAISPQPRPHLITAALGERYAVSESGFKLYPCVGTLHLPIEAALNLRSRYEIVPNSVDRIRIGLPEWALEDLSGRQRPPDSVGNARFSMSYVVAAAICDGELTPAQFTPEKLVDSCIRDLESKATFVVDAEADALFSLQGPDEPYMFIPCALEIDIKGTTHREFVASPIGYDPLTRPLTDAMIHDKFRRATAPLIGVSRSDAVLEIIANLENVQSVRDLVLQLQE